MNIDLTATFLALITFFGISALMALSLNMEYGVAGIPNFGKALFVSLGAYTAGITYTRVLPLMVGLPVIDPCGDELAKALQLRGAILSSAPDIGFINYALTLLIAAAVGGAVGWLAAQTARRVKEEWYLGLLLLVGSEAARIIVRGSKPIVCGFNGISGVAQPFGFLDNPQLATALFALFVLVIAGLGYLYAERLTRSPYGRMLRAVRENDSVTLGLGKDVPRVRAQVMFVSSAMAAIAGVLFATNLGFVNTNDYGVGLTLDIWVMVVLGGVGNHRGALLGAAIVTLLNRLTSILAIVLNASGSQFEFNYVRFIAFALILLFMLRYRRQGLLPERIRSTS